MKKKLKICTAIRDKDYEDKIIMIAKTQGWNHSFVNSDDVANGQGDSQLFFVIEDSYTSILDLIEKHNSQEFEFLPVVVLSCSDSKYSDWVKKVKYPEKYYHITTDCFSSLMPGTIRNLDALRDTAYYKKIFRFRNDVASAYKKNNNISDFLNEILPRILKILYSERGSIMLFNNNNNLVVEAATKKEIVGIECKHDPDSVAWTVVDTQKPVFVENIEDDSRFKKGSGYSKDFFLSIPVFVNNRIAGVLNLTDKITSLLFDENDHDNANDLLNIIEPYLLLSQYNNNK